MQIEVKMYYYHDLDLVSLYRNGCANFRVASKEALKAFTDGRIFRFTCSAPCRNLKARPVYRFYIKLDESKDASIIQMLGRIQKGYRNSFIKMVLRLYLCAPVPPEYVLTDEDANYFTNLQAALQAGKPTQAITGMTKTGTAGRRKKYEMKPLKKEARFPETELISSPNSNSYLEERKSISDFEESSTAEDLIQEALGTEEDLTRMFMEMTGL